MQLPDLSKIQTRLVTCGGIVVAGTLCPVGIGAMAAAVASGIVANDLVAHHLSHIATRLRNADEKLANHDLTHAVGLAIALIIQSLAEAGTYPGSQKRLKQLAKSTVKAWQEVAEAIKNPQNATFDPVQDEQIAALFSQHSADFFNQSVLKDDDDWKKLLIDWLLPKAKINLRDNVINELAKQLHTKFPLALREVLKQDFESGGKAFAGLMLSMLGEIQATLKEQQQRITNYRGNNSQPPQDITQLSADVQIAIQQLETLSQQLSGVNYSVEEIKVKVEQNFQQLGNQINSGFADVLREMGLSEERIKEVFRELKAEMQSWFQQVIDGQEEIKKVIIDGQEEIKKAVIESRAISLEQHEELVRLIEQIDTRKTAAGGSISFSDLPPTTTNWQGRIQEIQQLTAWFKDDNNQFIGIFGIGGIGKSTLAAKLYKETPGFEGKFWADVSQKPSFSVLARRILIEFGKFGGMAEQVEESRLVEVVVNCLQERRFLLVIDNLETLLQAGGGWQDSIYETFFKRWIDCAGKSEVLVTSQEIPQLYQVNPCWVELKGIEPDEGMALLKSLEIQGTDAELREFVEKVAGYPLLLNLVAGFLNEEVGKNAKITDLKDFGLADLSQLMADPRIKGRHRQEMVQVVVVLDASFNRLSEKLQQLLLALSVYRQSFDVTAANALIDEEVSVQELRDLVKRSLLQEERIDREWRFKFQPLIAAYARQKAIEFYQQSLAIARENCDRESEVRSLDNLGHIYDSLGEHQQAIEFYQQSLAIAREIGDRWFESSSLNNLGNAYNSFGEYQQAIEFYQQSLAIGREIGDRQFEAISLHNLGDAYNSLGEYQQAIDFYQQSLEIKREIGDRWFESSSINNLGHAYKSLGEYQQAIQFYQQCLEIKREIGDREGEAYSLNHLGNAYHSLKEYQQAIQFYQQCLEIKREIGDREGEASSLNILGHIYNSLGEYQQEIQSYQQSIEIAREIGDRWGEANSLNNLGIAYNFLGEYREAIDCYQESLQIKRESGDREGEAYSLNNLGNAYHSLKEYQQAIQFYQQSLEIRRELRDRQSEANLLQILSTLYHQTGRIKEGYAAGYQAGQILQELDIPLEGMLLPNWMKSAIKFAQGGKWQIALCFVAGLIAFPLVPFVIVAFVALILWRIIRAKLNRH